MTTDQELLELAAKAAELKWIEPTPDGMPWNPLVDYGDALRLAKKLRLNIIHSTTGPVMVMSHDVSVSVTNTDGNTCRAIVQAAAEIGRNM